MSLQNATTTTPPPPSADKNPPLPKPSSGWRTLDRTTQAAVVACALTVPLFLGLVAGPYSWGEALLKAAQSADCAPGPAGMRCVGTIAGTSSSSSCTDDNAEPASLSWGEHSDSGLVFNTAFAWNAPTQAKWLVVEISTGHVVTSNVTSGVGFAEWEGSERSALHVSLLDASHNVVWEQFIN